MNKKTKHKVLVVWPEEEYVMHMHTKIPKRWAYLVEIVTYLSKKSDYKYEVIDCLDPKYSHGEVLEVVAKVEYLCIILVSRFETAESLPRLSKMIKNIQPKAKILVYGDLVELIPNYFKSNANIDAMIMCGDWELGIINYLDYLSGKTKINTVRGVEILKRKVWHAYKGGLHLSKNSWALPDLDSSMFSKSIYMDITSNEVTLTVSRGCPFNCKFCSAVTTFGIKDRRKEIKEIIRYISRNKEKVSSFKFFSPTFTFDAEWVKSFCVALIESNNKVQWCATTRPDMIKDEEMVKLMADSGCYKIAMGIETLDSESSKTLRKFGNNYEEKVNTAIRLLNKYGIDIKALMMLGIKGQTHANILYTYSKLARKKVSIRAAAYSPRERLKILDKENKVTADFIKSLDKMTFYENNITGVNKETFLKLIFDTENFKKHLS